jgi:uroporphyrin-III C-methyltransferase
MSKKSKPSKKTSKSDSIEQAAMDTYADSESHSQEHADDDTQIRSAVIVDETEESLNETSATTESQQSDSIDLTEKEALTQKAGTIVAEPAHHEIPDNYNTMNNNNGSSDISNNDSDRDNASAKKPSKTIAWIALILALIALVITGYIWWIGEQKKDQTNNFIYEIANINDSIATLENGTLTQRSQQSRSIEKLQQQLQDQTALAQQQQALLSQMQTALDKLQAKQTGNASYWRMLEIKHLLQTATIKLAVERDPATAIALLDSANIKLEGQPSSLALQKVIALDIGFIKANYPVPPSRLLMQVESLHQQLLALPLINMTPEEVQETYAKESEAQQPKDWLDKIIEAAKPAYNIIPVNRALEPLLQPSEKHYLLMNMTLAIQQLQVAITSGNQALKNALIDKLMHWTSQYFDDKQEATQQFSQALAQLKTVIIHATPAPLKSLEWIEQNATLASGAQ